MELHTTVSDAHFLHHHHRHLSNTTDDEINAFWLMFGAVLVFFMQTGFAMLEVGSVQSKNTRNILLKNVLDASIGAIIWWLIGYGFAQGGIVAPESNNAFIGASGFALKRSYFEDGGGYAYAGWLFQWAFAATTATIVSGAVAERVTFTAYCVYSTCLIGFIYPVVVCWGWNVQGWLSAWRTTSLFAGCGAIDFAGSCVVHMTGGVAALVGAYTIGHRHGVFEGGIKTPTYGPAFQTLGVLILWFGWFGFNGASTLYIAGFGQVAAKTMVTTTIAAGTGAISTLVFGALFDGKNPEGKYTIRLEYANNGVLAGLVAITAGCSTCEPYGAFFIGMFAAPVFLGSSKMLKAFKIDDVVEAAPVHGFCGAYGTVMAACFATQGNYDMAYYSSRSKKCAGIFYGGDGSTLAANVTLIIMNIIWTGSLSIFIFGALSHFKMLRIDEDTEAMGMDLSEHGAPDYEDKPVMKTELVPTKDPEAAESGV